MTLEKAAVILQDNGYHARVVSGDYSISRYIFVGFERGDDHGIAYFRRVLLILPVTRSLLDGSDEWEIHYEPGSVGNETACVVPAQPLEKAVQQVLVEWHP